MMRRADGRSVYAAAIAWELWLLPRTISYSLRFQTFSSLRSRGVFAIWSCTI